MFQVTTTLTPTAILVDGFDEFTHSANNERSVISERPLADIDDMIDFELSPAGAPYHLGFSLTDDFQEIAEALSTDPSMRDFF